MSPQDRASLERELLRDEGCEAFPYTDTAGKLSIGVGRNLTDRGLRPDEISLMLRNDVDEVLGEMAQAFPWASAMNGPRQRVLANMLFNLGLAKLRGFKRTLGAMERGDYALAAAGMRASLWAQQVGARAARLAKMMESGRENV